ncbi:DUF2789 domain-containing protein [Psychrobacter sp. FDAARGOS_221]|uniref:DUF2789 domain-containing protein n=1 Tax=Psychrobacter sp. FDAARGOS_221 TaxID=1975705 RepID=UPI000BB57274|nr:DUF2789 domain-containing protein [Psychrobacter sp. FDAARGOS_221]PNK61289.1 DUF2789 domain-containing protein [Psychrobacter sp. FDAARGOS_221]
MLGEPEYTMNDLFAQLGLDSSDEAIEQFISEHKLGQDDNLVEADFWNDSQRAFLQEEWKLDAVWVEVIDELNARLHESA